MTKRISSIFSQNFIWFKSGIVTFFTIFLLTALFASGCGRKGKSNDKNGNESQEESENKEKIGMDSFIEKCHKAHVEWEDCLKKVDFSIDPIIMQPTNPPKYRYDVPGETAISLEMKKCAEAYEKSLEESFKLLSKEQLEQKRNVLEEVKNINPGSPLGGAVVCGYKMTKKDEILCLVGVSWDKLCSKIE